MFQVLHMLTTDVRGDEPSFRISWAIVLLLAREASLAHALPMSTSQKSQHHPNTYKNTSLKSCSESQPLGEIAALSLQKAPV